MSNLELQIQSSWDNLNFVREEAEVFLKNHHLNQDQINSLTMTISELSENAIKFGDHTLDHNQIFIYIKIDPKEILIQVKNKVKSFEEIQKLNESIQWIRSFKNPSQAFQGKLKEVASKELKEGESGLGLVRVAYEGECNLDFVITDDKFLVVSARYIRVV